MTTIDTANDVWDSLAKPERNGRGQYLIPHPDAKPGDKPKALTRATTYIKATQDMNGLIGWEKRMVALGIAARPDLYARLASIDPDDKATINAIVDDAKEAAQASKGANLGTALHEWTDAVDAGRDVTVPAPWDADIAAYRAEMARCGVEVVPGMIERTVALFDLGVAGTFDRLVTAPGHELPLVADLKTGNVAYAWGEIAMQLALYAHAETIYDWGRREHVAMPAVDRTKALVMHLPVGQAECTLYLLDIVDGWEMVQVAGRVRRYRRECKKAASVLEPPDALAEALEATTSEGGEGVEGVDDGVVAGAEPTATQSAATAVAPGSAPPPTESHAEGVVAERIEHLRRRVETLATIDGAMDRLGACWPTGVPTFRQHREDGATFEPWMLDDLAAIVADVEASVEAPFPPDRDPGGPLLPNDPRIADLRARVQGLPADLRDWVGTELEAQGVPQLSGGKATVGHLDTAADIIGKAERQVQTLWEKATLSLAQLAESVPGVDFSYLADLAGAKVEDGAIVTATLTKIGVQILDDLADATVDHDHGPNGDAPGAPAAWLLEDAARLSPTANALDRLVDLYGGKRPLLTAAKTAADLLGIDRPSKSDDVLNDVRLVACLAMRPGDVLATDTPSAA